MKKRKTYRGKNGKFKHVTEVNFSDLPIDKQTISEEDNFFNVYQAPDKGGDLEFYAPLNGREAIIMFCLARNMTQEQVADYFDISRKTVTKWYKGALKKLTPPVRGKDRR